MKLFLIMGLTLLFNLSLNLPLYPGEICKWVDDKGVTHFSQDCGNVPDKYRGQVKKRYWEEQKPEQSTKESQANENPISGWQKIEVVNDPNEEKRKSLRALCSERSHHIAKAQEKFPNEKNITKAWRMYYERYLTIDEKNRIPLSITSRTDPCRKEGLNPNIKKESPSPNISKESYNPSIRTEGPSMTKKNPLYKQGLNPTNIKRIR